MSAFDKIIGYDMVKGELRQLAGCLKTQRNTAGRACRFRGDYCSRENPPSPIIRTIPTG